jgi:hypothetical protein
MFKMQKSIWSSLSLPCILLAAAMLPYSSCKKKDDDTVIIPDVTVASVKSGVSELAGTSTADKVSLTADLVITFSKAVNPTTTADFSITSSGGVAVPFTVTNGGTTVTLNPTADLDKNVNYTLALKNTIKGTDGGPFVARTISFKTDNPAVPEVTLASVKSGANELLGNTSTQISTTANLVLTFSKEINATVASNFTLTPTGSPAVAFTVSTSGTAVTLNPTTDFLTGTLYTLMVDTSIRATDGGRFAGISITFTTDGPKYVLAPQPTHQLAYFQFNGDVKSAIGTWDVTNVSSGFATGRGGFANSAVSFNGTSDLIEVANGSGLFGNSSTQSIWIKSDTTSTHGLFVMGLNFFKGSLIEIDQKNGWIKNGAGFATADGTTTTEDLFFNGDGKFKDNGGWQGHSFNTDNSATGGNKALFANWVHVVFTYDAATKVRTLYLNGAKTMQSDFNLWPAGDTKLLVTRQAPQITPTPDNSNVFAFGFGKDRSATFWSDTDFGDYAKPGANHFKGMLDDVRFFDIALTGAEVSKLYNDEKL